MRVRAFFGADLEALLAQEYAAGERAVTTAMRGAQEKLKANWRGQVTSAGLTQRLANTVRGATYPKGTVSMNAASLVFTRAPKILAAHETGPVIRSNDGFWLAIPTSAAGNGRRGRKLTPGEWEARTGRRLRFVYHGGRIAYLVADDVRLSKRGVAGRARARQGRVGQPSIVVFTLLPQVRLKKKLSLMAAADQVATQIPADIAAAWPET
ncbi:DUF6441 family protein [Cereibacter sp. SYSU M97828]|nr:DUF6441 family protein [Cereibacter flavus]